ncbi:MAG: hypothetical protein COA97_04885 [Flavobacteriales bacterium]|nr:MAG: hypothetical protein COA97_04885 [Flavobacteriales bacterium]
MGKIDTCILTGVPIKEKRTNSFIIYDLRISGIEIEVFICDNCFSKIKESGPVLPVHTMKGLILNNKLPNRIFITSNSCNNNDAPVRSVRVSYPDFFETISFPRIASQKMENLLLYIYSQQDYDGQNRSISFTNEDTIFRNYFKNDLELRFYIESLKESALINGNIHSDGAIVSITHYGLNKIAETQFKPLDSKICFVAMAFSDETTKYRLAIKTALKNNGYDAVIIDEKHLESDETIPEAIFNEIRKAKFCIADFTKHRNGVYFESGYALGLGKQVIYTCHSDDFENAHFDIKQLQLLLYSSVDELEKRLTDKIDFWIK